MSRPLTARAVNTIIGRVDQLAKLVTTRIRGWRTWTGGMRAFDEGGGIVVRRFYVGSRVALHERDREKMAAAGLDLDIETGVVTRMECV